MARSDFRIEENVPVEDIMLDVQNARIRAGADQNDCIRRILRKRDQFLAICESIAKDGLTTMPILASPNGDGTYTVKDGNRRTTALKLLNNPEICPDADIKSRILKITAAYKNFPFRVDLTVTDNEQAMIREVLSRHQGEMGGAGQMGWSAYLRTLYLINHGHVAEYKRPGQYALWTEGQGIFVDDDFPISSLQRFFSVENLRLLGFDINSDDDLSLNLPREIVRQMATKIVGDFGSGKSVNTVFTPEQAKSYIDEVRASAGIFPTVEKSPSAPEDTSPLEVDGMPTKGEEKSDPSKNDLQETPANPLPKPLPAPRPVPTPTTLPMDRKKIFGTKSPGIAIPAAGYPKEQSLVVELRGIDLSKFPIAATMLLRALIEVSERHYRSAHSLPDMQYLRKNIKASAEHMYANNKLSNDEKDIVTRLCNNGGAMLEIESLQKMIHRETHNLNHQFVNTLWDNIGCFVKACWG